MMSIVIFTLMQQNVYNNITSQFTFEAKFGDLQWAAKHKPFFFIVLQSRCLVADTSYGYTALCRSVVVVVRMCRMYPSCALLEIVGETGDGCNTGQL